MMEMEDKKEKEPASESKAFCRVCNKDQDILSIEKDAQGEIVLLACGHKNISDVLTDVFHLSGTSEYELRNSSGKFIAESKARISGKTKLLATKIIEIDRERGEKTHQVWEEDHDGTTKLVHNEVVPLKKKEKKHENK